MLASLHAQPTMEQGPLFIDWEMAEYTNGCEIDLGKVPLKQQGLPHGKSLFQNRKSE